MLEPYRVTFVCTGNICRSPTAEWVFRRRVEDAGLDGQIEVDSSGTGGWHVGDSADPRTERTLRRAGYECDHRAKQFDVSLFAHYDLVLALDSGHRQALLAAAPDEESRAKVRMLREFDPDAGADLDVPDPYYGDGDGFAEVLALIEASCPGLLEHVRGELKAKEPG